MSHEKRSQQQLLGAHTVNMQPLAASPANKFTTEIGNKSPC